MPLKRRPTAWRPWLRWTAALAIYLALRFAVPRILPAAWDPWIVEVLMVATFILMVFWIGKTLFDQARDRRAFRTLRQVRAGDRWPLGELYVVELDEQCNGSRSWREMVVDERGVEFRRINGFARPIELTEVSVVRVRSTWIEIASGDESVRIVPRSFADRERMLWEFSVRFNDAVEQGIEPTAPTPAPPHASGLDSLDRCMTGTSLASALVGPAASANPAPPRKSGLGVGLFPPPPGESRESPM